MKIISVVGARPNFMKIAPFIKTINKHYTTKQKLIEHILVHTGQHYDTKMSKIFFKQLDLPEPDYYLNIGSGSHAEQTGRIMIEFEKVLLKEKPNLIIVVGDVNSTIACSLAACKLNIKVAHIEAGLRSYDRKMPEEINRILTDSISDYLFVSEKSGIMNLKNEGIPDEKIFFVGNVMIDSLINYLPKIKKSNILKQFGLKVRNYILVTLHRPSNVDSKIKLINLISMLNKLAQKKKILFPIHPRTIKNIKIFGLNERLSSNIILTDPIGYIDFINLIMNTEVILTDSGGIQEESTYLGIPCATLRTSTERPVTIELGTNYLVGDDFIEAEKIVNEILKGNRKPNQIPKLWDGKASERIFNIILNKIIF